MKRKQFLQLASGSVPAFMFGSLGAGGRFAAVNGTPELALHTIRDIQLTEVQLHYPRKVGRNARLGIHGRGPSVRVGVISTDRGARGWGMTRGGPKLLGKSIDYLDGRNLADVFEPAVGVTDPKARPFDIALHDLAGIITGKPVYELMGRTEPLVSRCYSGMIYFDDLDPEQRPSGIVRILEECQQDYNRGYRQFKLKIGRGNKWMEPDAGMKRDIAVTRAVADRYPDCDILVDANNGYTLEDTIEYLEGIGDIKLFWFEEPFHENAADYRALRKWMIDHNRKMFLADGEYQPDQSLLEELYRRRLLDVHLTDIIGWGFTPWRKLMPELMAMGISASPHAWGSLFKTHYIAHLAGAFGNTPTIEGVTCRSDDVDFGDYRLDEGVLIPSSDPGFGMELLKEV